MARGPGLFQRIASAIGRAVDTVTHPIERLFQGEPRPSRRPETEFHRRKRLQQQAQRQRQRQPQRPTGGRPAPPPAPPRPRPRPRPYDPFRASWLRHMGRQDHRYLDQRDFMREIFFKYDISGDQQVEMWRDYVKWMVKGGQRYRRNDPRGPFWRKYGINPDNWDWWEWRESMGYEHGRRAR